MRSVAWTILLFGLVVSSASPAGAQQIGPNAGAVLGQGQLNDHDGHAGTWSLQATLKDGAFSGTATITLAGATLSGPLKAGRSYYESGKCYFEVEQGRDHLNIGGPCTATTISGRVNGFLAGDSRTGEMSGRLSFGQAPASQAAAAIVPTAKLTCAWQERVGGVVAGDLQRYELRASNMVTLTLAADGSYRTNKASGRYVKEGDKIRLTTGAFAGAVGRLRPDRSGEPGVYFERDENIAPGGRPIVDIATTACTKAR